MNTGQPSLRSILITLSRMGALLLCALDRKDSVAQFRAEFLNAFNHPIYGGAWFGGGIANCLDCGNFGKVYSTRNDPRNIQLSLKLMF